MTYVGQRMIVDTPKADGNVFFHEEFLEFRARDSRLASCNFEIAYDNIDKIENYTGIKKTVVLVLKDGYRQYFYMYKNNTFIALVNEGRNRKVVVDAEAVEVEPAKEEKKGGISQEDLDKLSQLSQLHKDGALSDEEFAQQKALILDKYK